MHCTHCGAQIPSGSRYCPSCGNPVSGNAQAQEAGQRDADLLDGYSEEEEQKTYYDPQEEQRKKRNRTMGVVSYLGWIGLIIAFVAVSTDERDEFLRFHLNQSLVLNLFSMLGVVPVLGWLIDLVVFIFWITAIVGAGKGEMNRLPLIGDIHLL